MRLRACSAIALLLLFAASLFAQDTKSIDRLRTTVNRSFDDVDREVDDVLWYFKLGDAADIAKYRIATSKPVRMSNPTAQGAGNPVIIPVYVFTPKNLHAKAPMIVFAHGGVHGRLDTNYDHIFRE
ncbi:MAG TPA: hypothetical protein VLU46_02565, partial [Thermoanaerobaculia bacterium]|nr:hypothetical protein [Thermoanaerobaculia bacterium]